jgi:hypothetical protein
MSQLTHVPQTLIKDQGNVVPNKHQSLYKKQKLEEQSRTRGGKSGGVAGQPQHRRL